MFSKPCSYLQFEKKENNAAPVLVDKFLFYMYSTGYIYNGSTKTRNPESGNGNRITETETEYGICERRFQAIDLKKEY